MRNEKSHIHGEGFGDSHNWKELMTGSNKCSVYFCNDCQATFNHFYDAESNIHKAIEKSGIVDVCQSSDLKPVEGK